jgi:4-oxalocrotonate tautomerase
MPFVNIDMLEDRPSEEGSAIADAVHQAMVERLEVPERDRFQIVTRHTRASLRFNRNYLDIERTDSWVMVRVTLSAGRATEAKQAFYRRLAELLAERVGLRGEDLAVMLVENAREDWSFGHGQASYIEVPPDAWR